MSVNLALTDLVEYTDWERRKWFEWLRQHGRPALEISAGSHGDRRFQMVGDLVRHIFSAELRYVERLSGLPLTHTGTVPAGDIEALFALSQRSRQALSTLIETLSAEEWDAPKELKLFDSLLSATPRKIVVHVLLHEIRHWAQIATLFRLNGLAADFHDFLFSPVLGGDFKRQSEPAVEPGR